MSDKMRWRYGETNPVVAEVDSTTVIEIGDLLYLDGDDAKPAHMRLDETDEESNQQMFARNFLGVAMQRSRGGETAPIRVATTGVFEFDCPSTTFELGNFVGAKEDATGTALFNQQVTKVIKGRYAIGRVVKRSQTASTQVLAEIRSTVITGGIEGGCIAAFS